MCRSIKILRRAESQATDQEVYEAALQFVRKISGYRKPSQRNTHAFDDAISDITKVSHRLLDALKPRR